jgi:hypothetical protein
MERPAYILLVIRDGINDWSSLCSHFGVEPRDAPSAALFLADRLEQLSRAGFVELNKNVEHLHNIFSPDFDGLTFKISEKWGATQLALGISLKDIAQLSGDSIIVKPFFGRPEGDAVADIFVMMPFLRELGPVYEDHLSAVARNLHLSIRRADDFFGAHSIMKDVWNAIVGSKICIADCTGRNPNVLYEIGVAHTIGRPVVLITQRVEDVPFDLNHVRYIVYELTPRGMKKFEETLRSTLVEEFDLDDAT